MITYQQLDRDYVLQLLKAHPDATANENLNTKSFKPSWILLAVNNQYECRSFKTNKKI